VSSPASPVSEVLAPAETHRRAVAATLATSALSGLPLLEVATDDRYRPVLRAVIDEVVVAAGGGMSDRTVADADVVEWAVRAVPADSDEPLLPVDQLADAGSPLLCALAEIEAAVRRGERVRCTGTLDLLAVQERLVRLAGGLNAVVSTIPVPLRAPSGPLTGRAVGVKDTIAVRGVPMRCGSPASDPQPTEEDALLVRRLREAGAEVVATPQCPEYTAGFAHPDVGDTRNPRDPAVTSGGSSGGSAAVVAAGACAMAVGTDCGGSVRIPAAYCGVVGVKPSYGLVPLDGVHPLSPTCDHVGVLADTVSSAASLLAVIADRSSLAGPFPPAAALTLGVLVEQFDDPSVTPEAADCFCVALDLLAAAGVVLHPVTAPWCARLPDLDEDLAVIVSHEAYAIHRDRDTSRYADGTRALLELGASQTDEDLAAAHRATRRLVGEIDSTMLGVDALIGPTVGFRAPEHDPPFGIDENAESRFTGPYNLSGHPVVSLPVPVPAGSLPLAVQLAAARGADAKLLAAATVVEASLARGPAAGPATPITTEGRR
jgi:Asp-tRNA(Asn)/Glu-tRNA(Gln) amidotransferase A subunit family amidase